jgi:hypothetical protein
LKNIHIKHIQLIKYKTYNKKYTHWIYDTNNLAKNTHWIYDTTILLKYTHWIYDTTILLKYTHWIYDTTILLNIYTEFMIQQFC